MIWVASFFIFFQYAFAQVEFREIYAPVIVDDLPFTPVIMPLNEGIVRGRKITVFDKDVEVYRGLELVHFRRKHFLLDKIWSKNVLCFYIKVFYIKI